MLLMFDQSVEASFVVYIVVCWGGSVKKREGVRLHRLVRVPGFVGGKRAGDSHISGREQGPQ